MNFAGTPAHNSQGGILRVTTLPAPMIEYFPIVTGFVIIVRVPINAPSSIFTIPRLHWICPFSSRSR